MAQHFAILAAFATTAVIAAPDDGSKNLTVLINAVTKLERELETLISDEKKHCDNASAALKSLAASTAAPEAQKVQLAWSAAQARKTCLDTRASMKEAKEASAEAWTRLQLSASLAVGAVAKIPQGPGELIKAAAEAQDLVAQARKDYSDPYVAPDAAAASLLRDKDLKPEDRTDLIKKAQNAQRRAPDVRESLGRAQQAANRLVEQALVLQDCGADCKNTLAWQSANQANEKLKDALDTAKAAYNAGKEAGLFVTAGINYPADADKRANAIAFAKLLDSMPDARGLLGEESAVGLSANGTDKRIAVKLGSARDLPWGWRQWSATLSAPLGASDNSQLFSRADGFDNAATLALSSYWLLGGKGQSSEGALLTSKNHLTAAGFKISAGLGGKLEYRDAVDTTKKLSAERTLKEGSIGGYLTVFTRAVNEQRLPGVHTFSVDYERKVARGDKETRCPAAPAAGQSTLLCVNDYFSTPKFERHLVWAYEYRLQGASWALVPRITYDNKERQTDVRLPLYLIRSGDADAKKAFTAGLDFLLSRSRGDDGKYKTDRGFGLFVGLPFSLYATSRD